MNVSPSSNGPLFPSGRQPEDIASKILGSWSYAANTLTSGTLTATGRCVGLSVFANGGDGSFKISGLDEFGQTISPGNTITVRAGELFEVDPQGLLVDPVITWESGTIDCFIEAVN